VQSRFRFSGSGSNDLAEGLRVMNPQSEMAVNQQSPISNRQSAITNQKSPTNQKSKIQNQKSI